ILVPPPPARQVRRRTDRAGGLQRGAGERRRMAPRWEGDRLSRDPSLRRPRRAPEDALQAGVRQRNMVSITLTLHTPPRHLTMTLGRRLSDVIMASPWGYARSSKASRPISKESPQSATMPLRKPRGA